MKQKLTLAVKRITAVICAIATLVTGLYAVNWTGSNVQAAYTEISISSTDRPFQISGTYLNVTGVSGITDLTTEGTNFLTETFANEWMTFGGGLTYAELVTGLRKAVVANATTIQFNWNHSTTPRTEGFAEGASFTIKQGAPLPYNGTSSYVQLDANYTFTFQAPYDATTEYNRVIITKQKTTTISLGTTQITYASGGNNFYFDFDTSDAASGAYYIVDYNNNILDESYEEYIDFAGIDLATLKDTYQMRIKFNAPSKCIQIVSWGTVADVLTVGDSITFFKGMPITYTNSAGDTVVAYLDNDYIYKYTHSNSSGNPVFKMLKYDATVNTFGLTTGTYTASNTQQNNGIEYYFNVDLSPYTDSTNAVSVSFLGDSLVADYVDFAGESIAKISDSVHFRYISNSNDDVLQMAFLASGIELLEVGDKITLKKGLPIVYTDTELTSATLEETYVFEVTAKADQVLTFNCYTTGEYSLTGASYVANTYAQMKITPASVADESTRALKIVYENLDASIIKTYFSVSGKTYDDLVNTYSYKWRGYIDDTNGYMLRFQFSSIGMEDGDTVIWKKGFPLPYTTADGKSKISLLDKDYGFVYDEDTNTFTYDETLGNEEVQEGLYVYDFNSTDFDTTVASTEGNDALKEANVATLLSDTSDVPETFTKCLYGGGSSHYASVPVDFGKPIDLSKVTSVKVRMYIPTYSNSGSSVFRILTNESTSSGVSYEEADYTDIGGTFGEWSEIDITEMLKSTKTVKDEEGYLGRFILAFRTREAITCYFDYISIECTDTFFVEEDDTYKTVTILQLGADSGFDTADNEWDVYAIPQQKVPGIEGVTTFDATYEIDGTEYSGTFTRSDDTNGLYLTIPADNLAADADDVFVTIKAGEYDSSGTSAGINIKEDFTIYVYNGSLTQYAGDVTCETDEDTYVIEEADTVEIDGQAYAIGEEYATSGDHLLTYVVDGTTYAKRLIIYRIGDVNDDEAIDVKDLVVMKKKLANERELSMAGEQALDMNIDNEMTADDAALLRKYLVSDEGVLVLAPGEGATVANASEAAETLITDYTLNKAQDIKTGEDIYYRDVTILKWLSFENVTEYTVKVATQKDMSDAITYTANKCSLELINLLTDTDYYWTVAANGKISDVQTFHTADTIRTVTIDGVSNTRDGGGWSTIDGNKVKEGMFYRGGKLEDITDDGINVMLNQLGIKTDIDLRNSSETNGTTSPMGCEKYFRYSGPYYWGTTGINADAYKEALANEILAFANEDNYPIYVHCSLGRDRTGTICFLINALLGVSEEDLYLDYEFSFLSVTGTKDNAAVSSMTTQFKKMYDNVKAYASDGTMAEATEAFLVTELEDYGVTSETIATIRKLLLEE